MRLLQERRRKGHRRCPGTIVGPRREPICKGAIATSPVESLDKRLPPHQDGYHTSGSIVPFANPIATKTQMRVAFGSLIGLSLLATMITTLRVYPHQLAYFNELSGGPEHGSEHLLGSNLDWGQGLLELDRLLDSHPEWGPVALYYSGSTFLPPESLGTRAIPQSAGQPASQLAGFSHVAISVNTWADELKRADELRSRSHQSDGLFDCLSGQSPLSLSDHSMLIFATESQFSSHAAKYVVDPRLLPTDKDAAVKTFFGALPSLADARDSRHLTVPTLLHVLLLHGLGDTGLRNPASGLEAIRLLTDERLARAAFGASPFVRTRYGLRYKIDGVVLTEALGVGESHRDQCLATFADLGLPLNQPIVLDKEICTLNDLVSESIANFRSDQHELTWTAIAYAGYLPPARKWTDRFGRTTSFSQLLESLIASGYSGKSCGGMHVLQAIAAIVEADYRYGILDRRVRVIGHDFLRHSVERALLSQSRDGAWDLSWYDLGSRDVRNDRPSFESKVVVTGHMLELLQRLRDQPPDRAIVRSTRWLIGALKESKSKSSDVLGTCPLAHALRAVRLSYCNRARSYELAQLFASL
jgi:hypothetical protein